MYRWMKEEEFMAALQKMTEQIKRQAIQFLDSKSYDAACTLWKVAKNDRDTRSRLDAVNSILNRSIGCDTINIPNKIERMDAYEKCFHS